MNTFKQNLIMSSGVSDYKQISIPSGQKFLSIINNSNNKIEVYQEQRTTSDIRSVLITTPAYTQQTIPIGEGREFTFLYTDGGGSDDKKAELIFSDTNLGIQGIIGTLISGTVTVGADSVGLARQAQLPAALTGSGNLKAAVTESLPAGTNNIGDVDIVTMPNVTLNALPAGTNNIGDVDIVTMPTVTINSLPAGTNLIGSVKMQQGTSTSLNITADTVIKASAGRVIRISVVVAGSAAGAVHDVATTGGAATSNKIAEIPNTVGVIYLDWNCGTGITIIIGTGQTVAVSFE